MIPYKKLPLLQSVIRDLIAKVQIISKSIQTAAYRLLLLTPKRITALPGEVSNVSSQATEADKAIVRMETKVEYIIKGIDEIKAEVKSSN